MICSATHTASLVPGGARREVRQLSLIEPRRDSALGGYVPCVFLRFFALAFVLIAFFLSFSPT